MELESDDIKRLIQLAFALEEVNPGCIEQGDRLLFERLKNAYAAETPCVINPKVLDGLNIGDYVFASRWSDCSPGDPWQVGCIVMIQGSDADKKKPGGVLLEGSFRWWPRAMRISQEQGARIVTDFSRMENEVTDYGEVARIFGLPPATVEPRRLVAQRNDDGI